MKKNILFFSVFLLGFLLLFGHAAYAYANNKSHVESDVNWSNRSYTPELSLRSNFNIMPRGVFTAFTCGVQVLPFWEGFNSDSSTLNCWTILDENKDWNLWRPNNTEYSEGDQGMYLYGGLKNSDWLISPAFQFDVNKIYKLTYYYKTDLVNKNEFEVLASNKGIGATDFDKVIVGKKLYNTSNWVKETVYITNYGGTVNLSWHVSTQSNSMVYIDDVFIDEVACVEPQDLDVKQITTAAVTLFWNDKVNTTWEYFVEKAGGGGPVGSGIVTKTSELTITAENNTSNLVAGQDYEYYIRAQCGTNNLGEWIGPFRFTVACSPSILPFTENFNLDSDAFNCWRLLDHNKDKVTNGNNGWTQHTSGQKEGSAGVFFKSTSNELHDDWLISPTLKMKGGIYAITYYYKTTEKDNNEFEVLLSRTGTDPVAFKEVLETRAKRNAITYVKKILYVKNITADVNIAWHVVAKGNATVYIDLITIEEVSCVAPDQDVVVSKIEKDRATFTWKDPDNTSWEYFVQPLGMSALPVGSGLLVKKDNVEVTKTTGTGGANLQPNTWYEFFVRSDCGSGKNSIWIGPIAFKTACDVMTLPFWEGFNVNSNSTNCWTVVDHNKDAISGINENLFSLDFAVKYEGDRSMKFWGVNTDSNHDDWLISPSFKLDASKFYRLKYHYKTTDKYQNDFEVLLSDKGVDVSSFTKKILTQKGLSNESWKEEIIVFQGFTGNANIAWHVTTQKGESSLFLDNVFLEEIVGCPEPTRLGVKHDNNTAIFWNDDFGAKWEYVVQYAGGTIPAGKGTATDKKENTIIKDQLGKDLDPNTDYEFYVRTLCANGEYSIWVGPLKFRTPCAAFSVPFWEGFNTASQSLICWTILDENKDSASPTGTNIWTATKSDKYEGSHAMVFNTLNAVDKASDDWLISPRVVFDKNKIYRLKYQFKVDSENKDNSLEVLTSNNGIKPTEFKKKLIENPVYKVGVYQQEIVFISGLDGEVNIGWHIKGKGPMSIYVDDVFIEEVVGCPEPIQLNVKDVEVDQAIIGWSDGLDAKSWEFYVQDAGKGIPKNKGVLTTKKENAITTDQSGKGLKPNAHYEYYVRTVCGDGSYSIWAGPYSFITPCDVYAIPFWEGFNKTSQTSNCWTIVDANHDESTEYGITLKAWNISNETFFEGDQDMLFFAVDFSGADVNSDDWLISPDLKMDNSNYVLKYHYKTNDWDGGRFEVLFSNEGTAIDKFKKTLVPITDYNNGLWKEKVVFFTGVTGTVNLAWHADGNGMKEVHIDNVSLKKVETCPEPYYITTSNLTGTGMDVSWQQEGGVSQWEVVVVNYGDAVTAVPVKTLTVNTNPKTTITGLTIGQVYTIYVRAKCVDGSTNSDWSTPVHMATKIGANDECSGAINIPVNGTLNCDQMVTASLFGATQSNVVAPICNTYGIVNDVWFEFTATAKSHLLALKDLVSISGKAPINLYGALYDQSCGALTNTALGCYAFTQNITQTMLSNLVPGKKYYFRLGSTQTDADYVFNWCLTTATKTPLEVSLSGDKYSVEELVKEVLVRSNCDLVSNVKFQNGDGSAKAMAYNTLGYFNKQGSDFPFEEGIVLTTNEIQYVPGPYKGYSVFRGGNAERWAGDKDVNDAIDDAGGGPTAEKRVTQIEFDFIPVKEEIKFDYLFASNSYHKECGDVCNVGAMFAAWLVDSTTGEGQNLAKVTGTNMPIAINTIRDSEKSGVDCSSRNSEQYWKHYDNNQDNPLDAAIDFVGLTKAMESETVSVIPGRKYHIKLAVMDFCTNESHSSVVFFNAGSFNLGNLDLGADLLVENGTALCGGQTTVLKSGLGTDNVAIQWYKNDVLIPGANAPDLEVSESGVYKVVAKYTAINCEVMGEIKVEIFPAISSIIKAPIAFEECRNSLTPVVLDLSNAEIVMFEKSGKDHFTTRYFENKNDALQGTNPIATRYELDTEGGDKIVYVRVEDQRTGCSEVFEIPILVTTGASPVSREDVIVCGSYTLPDLEKNQYYYTGPAATGITYNPGDVLTEVKSHHIYVLQRNNEAGCYEEVSYKINITAPVKADVFPDITLECQLYLLTPLSVNNKYYTQSGGQGVELAVGSWIPYSQLVYVYASSQDGLCVDESSFKVAYAECPIQKGISPNGDGLNDSFDLSQHGVTNLIIYNRYGMEVFEFQGPYTNQWKGQDKKDKLLPDGTYFYVAIAHGKTKSGWVQINK